MTACTSSGTGCSRAAADRDADAGRGARESPQHLLPAERLDREGGARLPQAPREQLGAAEQAAEHPLPARDHGRQQQPEHRQRVRGGGGEGLAGGRRDVDQVRRDAAREARPAHPRGEAHERPQSDAERDAGDEPPGEHGAHANHRRSSGSRPSAIITR